MLFFSSVAYIFVHPAQVHSFIGTIPHFLPVTAAAWCRLLMPRFASLFSWFTPSTRHMATQAIMQQQQPLPIMSVWCVGRNYAEHIKELGNQSADGSLPPYPMIFLKSGGSVLASGRDLVLPSWSKDVHHEVRQGLPSCMPCMPSPPIMHE